MKKTLIVTLAMLLAATAARAFDFKAKNAAGQWLYYSIVNSTSVKVVNPNWDQQPMPSGVLQIPSTATNTASSTTYNVTAIDDNAFKNCADITVVVIPEGVTTIGRMAFAFCTALDSVSLPSTLTYLGSQAFTSTSFFSSSHLNADGLLIAGAYLIGSRANITGSVTVPDGIEGLGNMAFYSCSMERVTLPDGLRFIGENAFQDCTSLDTLELLGTTPPSLASNAFTNASAVILVPCHSGDTYREASQWSNLTIVEHCSSTGIAQVEETTFVVTATKGGIVIGNEGNALFTVSDITGHRVAESHGGFVALPSHGVYIVSTPGVKATKVVY